VPIPTRSRRRSPSPIEDAIAGLNNIDTLTSTSTQGLSSVNVAFTTAANIDLIGVDVERVVNGARGKLPSGADAPTVSKGDTSSIAVLTLAVSGPQPLDQIDDVAQNQVKRAIEAVPGVSSVSVVGAPTREIQIKADLDKLQARGLGLTSLQTALVSAQLQQPAGTLVSNTKDANVVLSGLVGDPQQLGNVVVSQTSSGPVYVKDVATIDDTQATAHSIARVDGVRAITLTASKLKSASTLSVSPNVKAAISRLQLPEGMQVRVVTDLATYTQQSFTTIEWTLMEAVVLTGIILLLFLHTWRSTLIVMISIPTSLLTTLGLMNLLGLDLNLFSMLALTLSVGILVDDSIVVIENIARHLGLGEAPVLAAIRGRSEIGMAALTITMLDVVVYVPIALISGIAGQFIRPFAIVIAAATLASLVVSFTLTPLLASRYLSIEEALKAGNGPLERFGRCWDRGYDRLAGKYRGVLHWVLTGHWLGISGRWLVIALGFSSLLGGVGLYMTGRISIDIFPSGDQSEVDVTVVMPSATDIQVTSGVVQQLETRLQAYPEVRMVYSNTGTGASGGGPGGGATGGDQARMTVLLVPISQRQQSATQLSDMMRRQLGKGIPDLTLRTSVPNAFGFGGFGSQAIQVQVLGSDPATLNGLVDQVTAVMQATDGAAEVNNDNQKVTPQFTLNVDRAKAAQLGVTSQSAATAPSAAVDGLKVATYQKPGQSNVDIRLMADDRFRASTSNLANLPLLTSNGTVVSLSQIGALSETTAPTSITHDTRLRSVTVNASAGGGRSSSSVQSAIQTNLAKINVPAGYKITYAGQAQQGTSAFIDIFKALGVALILMYMLMMLLFGSVTLPLAVLMSLPLAVVGALGAMALTGSNFTLFAMLGVTLLMGLVGKNAVLMVDYTDTLRKQGQNRNDALLHAGPTRLRPIIMTTLSVIVSLTPVATGIEAGSELLRAAAVVLIGGLLTSTLLTLVFVPAMYTIFDDIEALVVRLVRRIATPRKFEPVEEDILHPQLVEEFATPTAPSIAMNGHSPLKPPSAVAS